MRKHLTFAMFLLIVLFPGFAQADAPIYTGLLWDSAPAVTYNSQSGEFLVVWNMFNLLSDPSNQNFYGPLMGQRLNEDGEKIGQPFEIINAGGVLPDVAYNAAKNEYLVVAEQWFNTVGQRVSAKGALIGSTTTFLTNARYPRVVYNSLAQNYLVAGAWPTGSGTCNIQFYTIRVDGSGQPVGAKSQVAEESFAPCDDGAVYAIAYAPVTSTTYPQGKYLLAIRDGRHLRILGSDGTYSVDASTYNDGSQIEDPFNVDVAFGYLHGDPVFFLVWGETDSPFDGYDGKEWNGIWSGFIDAEYHTKVANMVFPISLIWAHYSDDTNAKTWRPVTAYNGISNQFVVAWRETPGTDPRNMTNENHIRSSMRDSTTSSPGSNTVVSATTGLENPTLPAIAASSRTASCLITWEDHRGLFLINAGDIYGSSVHALPPCPECSGDPVVLTQVTFPAGTACECTDETSITVGNGTTVKSGAVVYFKSPTVKVKSGATFESGALVHINQ